MNTLDAIFAQSVPLMELYSFNPGRPTSSYTYRQNCQTHGVPYPYTRKRCRWTPRLAFCFSFFLIAAASAFFPHSLSAAPAYVQGNSTVPQTISPRTPVAVSVAYSAQQKAGNLNVVIVGWNDTVNAVSSITDTLKNTYHLVVGPTKLSNLLSQSIYYANNIAGGSNTVTVTFSGSTTWPDIRILEYSGLHATAPFDVAVGASGTSKTSSSGSLTTTSPSEVLVAANTVTTVTTGAGPGFTKRILTSPDGDIAQDEIVSSMGSYTATAPISPSGGWVMQMVALRAASGSGDAQPPTVPANLTATAVSSGQINLSWTASTDNVGVTKYLIEQCQGGGCTTFVQIATATGTTYSNTGLAASTSYSYRVRATDAAGNLSGYSNTATAMTTSGADTLSPTAPASLAATAVSGSQINLSWTASTDNVGVTKYLIEQCQGGGCTTFVQIATATGTTYSNTGLAASTSYSYRVRATDAAGNLSGYSNTATAITTSGADTLSPTAPASLAATAVSGSQINLSWTASTDNVGVTQYLIEQCQGGGCTTFVQIATATGTTYSNTGLAASTSYSYRVRATDAAGNLSGYSNTATAMTTSAGMDTLAPTAPANLTATAVSGSQIILSWTASTDNVGVTQYLIEQCQGGGCTSFLQIATATGATYSNSGLTPSTSYSYRVRATDAAGNLSSYSNTTSATPLGTSSPTTPSKYVQGNYATPQTPQTTVPVTVPYTGSQTAGNLNVVIVGWNDTVAQISSVTDTKLNSYQIAAARTTGTGISQAIYFAKNILPATGGENVVRVTFASAASFPDVRIMEYSGTDPNNPLDVTTASSGNSASTSTGILTTTYPTDLLVGANTVATVTSGPGANFLQRLLTFPDGDIAEDRVVTATGPYSASAPLTDAGPWVMQLVAFRTAPYTPPDPAQFGMWSGTVSLPIVSVHSALLPSGKILMSDGQDYGSDARVWDPATNTIVKVPAPVNIFCGAWEQMTDGRIIVFGGNAAGHTGLSAANVFDPSNNSWTVLPNMSFQRWYPAATMLPDGSLIVTSGESNCDGCDVTMQEIYHPSTNTWSLVSAPFKFPYYPHVYLLSDGRIIVAGTTEAPIVSQVLNRNLLTWTSAQVGGTAADGGSSAMYLPDKIVKTGTSVDPDTTIRPSVATAYILDMAQASPAWLQVNSMSFPRTFHNTTLLPDGNVLVTGGGPTTDAIGVGNAVLPAELWSPDTEAWTTLASMNAPRLYHSDALLLPDGRVVVSGGGRFNGVNEPTDQLSAEFFAPPYLFKGPRPAITFAPPQLTYGQTFTVQTPDAARIAKVSLIRFGTVTHDINMGQRFLPLSFVPGSGALTVTAPIDANLAPPGNYLLFLVDNKGVPSVAAVVQF
jgi:chitodextrinase